MKCLSSWSEVAHGVLCMFIEIEVLSSEHARDKISY